MVTQQFVAAPARAALFLVLTVNEGSEEVVRDVFADLSSITRSVSFRVPGDQLNCVLGIGAGLWDRMFDLPRPRGLHPFVPLDGPRHSAPSTPGDLLLHVRAHHMDVCFELSRQVMDRLRGHAVVVDETHGFKYFDERDLLGFVDGTENPEGDAAPAAVLIADEDPDYAGGSYVIVQKYRHDLEAWGALPVEEQERAIGRSKLEDVEMPDAVKPINSHVHLNTVVDADGVQRQILRDNMPFGELGTAEFGTYFIGYAADPGVIEQMLRNMFLGSPPGNTDRILDFSTAHTGTLFFTPALDFLDDVPGPRAGASAGDAPADTAPVAAAPGHSAPSDAKATDLGIGGLRAATH
ncbi:Dyp-type peroxidase [Microbacterium azadirachtae]|uniref:Dyp-type peroxidase n=1 Tax=Microbacterium azadirachtae TaxID=582680 RepID=UPI00088C220B|nr:Dyp-type peroxidase [Microbacterium azadirachtae]SDL69968.1 putative iron-dependent peroxidase [Microbacterium azadirachtae]SEF99586.1 putative iron-dependent peroxidase [Microbacterium azadirachtae]SEG01831.1 putative iron-dependent peroxidase [Microbacterium azadirachtae]